MPKVAHVRTAAVELLSQARRWMTLQEISIAVGSAPKAVRVSLKTAVADATIYYRLADGRACYCIGIVPAPRLDVAKLPAKGRPPAPREWTRETVRSRCDEVGDCWIWKQGVQSKGYPQASINGKTGQSVRAYVFTQLMGKKAPASRRSCIVSLCGNVLCVSPACLVLRQRSSILREQWGQGLRRPTMKDGFVNRKLTAAQVDEIRALPAGFNQSEVARRMGVHARTICKVARGETFKRLPVVSVFEWRP